MTSLGKRNVNIGMIKSYLDRMIFQQFPQLFHADSINLKAFFVSFFVLCS